MQRISFSALLNSFINNFINNLINNLINNRSQRAIASIPGHILGILEPSSDDRTAAKMALAGFGNKCYRFFRNPGKPVCI
jgi:hypothetical protein